MSLLALGEFHRFSAAESDFLYLVPSAAVFQLDEPSRAVLDLLGAGPLPVAAILEQLPYPADALRETIAELIGARALRYANAQPESVPRELPPSGFPLSTLVLNVSNQCNLSCAYCYEYGEDKIVDTAFGAQPKFMSQATADAAVDFLLGQCGPQKLVHLTFFGGETLLNFRVVKTTIAYARQRAEQAGKRIDFSLTTNATLLSEEIIEYLAENEVGVTISIDGPREMQDQFRVYHNGVGSYDVIAPKIRSLLQRHRSRPIGARVTLTSQTLDAGRIFRHLREEIGFWEVGFAPVTTSPNRLYAIGESGFDRMLAQFRELADEFLECSAAGRHHGFSNVRDTLEEIHKGVSKAYPCGAGLGLMGVSTDGDVALCHRFAGSDSHKIGSVGNGIDRQVQVRWLEQHHIAEKTDCSRCWARPLCSGGCYHEAHVRYGDTAHPNLHYCEWIRGWTDTCLRIYGALWVRNPKFLEQLDQEPEYETSAAS
ncbi:MAG: quinohemoprotein amine dehydrogenase maturation protein [Acidobacteria bacterium]|nr:quinohemoprotein amine dehydrogenase maturation protein [Acidobacteriota bacterium]